jgi:hypothetical protein
MRTFLLICLLLTVILTSIAQAQNGGYALQFDGADDYVEIPHNSLLNVDVVTMEMWMYWEASVTTDTQFLIGKGFEQLEIHTGYQNDQLQIVENALRFIPTNGVYFDTEAHSISQNQWNHIAFIYAPGNSFYKCYINGKETPLTKRGGNTVTTAIINTTDSFLMGKRFGNDMYYRGRLDEVRIWNTVRTEAEINSNMFRELEPQTGLVTYYKMSGGSGTTLSDNSDNGINGSLSGAVWKVSGAFSGARRALNLNETNSYAKVTNASILQPTQALTLEAMVKISSTQGSYQFIIDNGFASNQLHGGYTLGTDGTKFRTWASNGATRTIVVSDEPFELNRWYHVASVYDGQTLTLYVDGRLAGSGNLTGALNYDRVNENPDYGLNLGRYKDDNEEFFAGLVMDEVRIWGISRTPSQIRSTMMTNLAGSETGLLAYLRFDHNDSAIAYDITSSGSNAILYSAAITASKAFTTWLGSESSQWNQAANWSDGVPASTDNAGIYSWEAGYNTEISGVSPVNNLLIASGSTVPLSSELFVNGNLIISGNGRINQSQMARLTIKGSLIMEQNATGAIKIE